MPLKFWSNSISILFILFTREGYVPKGTTLPQLYKAKVIYDSAFHPDSGKRMYGLGTMCAQVPGGMVITGILLAYYKWAIFTLLCDSWLLLPPLLGQHLKYSWANGWTNLSMLLSTTPIEMPSHKSQTSMWITYLVFPSCLLFPLLLPYLCSPY